VWYLQPYNTIVHIPEGPFARYINPKISQKTTINKLKNKKAILMEGIALKE
jgi:hypothetical protein